MLATNFGETRSLGAPLLPPSGDLGWTLCFVRLKCHLINIIINGFDYLSFARHHHREYCKFLLIGLPYFFHQVNNYTMQVPMRLHHGHGHSHSHDHFCNNVYWTLCFAPSIQAFHNNVVSAHKLVPSLGHHTGPVCVLACCNAVMRWRPDMAVMTPHDLATVYTGSSH